LTTSGEAVEAAAFLDLYAERSGTSPASVLESRVVATCRCNESVCEGWQVIPEDCLMPWRGERVVIRGFHPHP
jgi:hypothetical protein